MADPRALAFRKELNKWKKDTFFTKLVNESNDKSIDRRIDEAHSMFHTLIDKIREMEQVVENRAALAQKGGNKEVSTLLNILGPEDTWTEPLLDQVRSILITDLYEYPLTFNSALIDQFKEQPNFPKYE